MKTHASGSSASSTSFSTASSPFSSADPANRSRWEKESGGIEGRQPHPLQENATYFLSIIDILQVYDASKRAENVIKGIKYDKDEISSVSGAKYGSRFSNYVESISVPVWKAMSEQEKRARRHHRATSGLGGLGGLGIEGVQASFHPESGKGVEEGEEEGEDWGAGAGGDGKDGGNDDSSSDDAPVHIDGWEGGGGTGDERIVRESGGESGDAGDSGGKGEEGRGGSPLSLRKHRSAVFMDLESADAVQLSSGGEGTVMGGRRTSFLSLLAEELEMNDGLNRTRAISVEVKGGSAGEGVVEGEGERPVSAVARSGGDSGVDGAAAASCVGGKQSGGKGVSFAVDTASSSPLRSPASESGGGGREGGHVNAVANMVERRAVAQNKEGEGSPGRATSPWSFAGDDGRGGGERPVSGGSLGDGARHARLHPPQQGARRERRVQGLAAQSVGGRRAARGADRAEPAGDDW